jgi:predicted transcriptional regulator
MPGERKHPIARKRDERMAISMDPEETLRGLLRSDADHTTIEQQLREAGTLFVDAHDKAAVAIRSAADAGMSAQTIARVSGLSPDTVGAFLRATAHG